MKTILSIFFGCVLVFAGVFSGVRPAFAQSDEVCPRPADILAPDLNIVTAEQVENGEATLAALVTDFLTYAAIVRSSPLATGYVGCLLTHEGLWNFGSTYVITTTLSGRLVLHGKDLLLSGGLLDPDVLELITQAASSSPRGGAFELGDDDGYALSALSFFNPDGSPGFMTVGLDIKESHLVEEPLDPGDAPAVTARDVVDRSTLKTFVNEAADYFQELYETEGYDGLVRVKRVFRDTTGYWRHGPIYLFGIDRTGYVFFHGAFPEKFELQTLTNTLRDAVTGELILPQIIAAAASSEEGGFVEYHFDNPDDDTDSAEILKVTYALERENTFTLPDSTQRTLITIMGAGIYEPGVTSVEPVGGEIPTTFALDQNYPNPFNPSTTIEFSLDRAQTITLTVHDMLGRQVRVLVDGVQPVGRYSVSFDGSGLASGTYLYVLRTEQNVAVKKMSLLE